jgi:phosphatidylinositol-3-phosphatase
VKGSGAPESEIHIPVTTRRRLDPTIASVSTGMRDDGPGGQSTSCESCGTELSRDQRYCLACGTRIGAIPAAFARWLSGKKGGAETPPAASAEPTPEAAENPAEDAAAEGELEDASFAERYMPEPRSAAVATMALLAFGVIIGAATGPLAQSAAVSPIIVEVSPEAVAEALPESVEEAPEVVEEAPLPPEAVASGQLPESIAEEPIHLAKPPPEKFPTELLPPVTHVFLVVLGDRGFEETYGEGAQATYLSQALREQGELLENYYAVTQGDLANEIALLSGQGPTPATTEDCPEYADLTSTTVGLEEQVEGEGCVYPATTKTLPGQLTEAKKTWKAYVEGGCSHEAPTNPFAFFHSIADTPECAERSVGLEQLGTDLESEKTTPNFSYVVPEAGDEQQFLERVVPEIQESDAYKQGGLIAIVSAQAPQEGANADASACCGTPEYPNLPPPSTQPAASGPIKPSGGGGHVGLLLLSPFVTAGTTNESGYYNHFALLRSIEELFGLPAIGYAANPVLTVFDSSVYNLSS